MLFVSLGRACEVGFQIRMHTPKSDSDFFDWLITPFDGLMIALSNGLEGLLDPNDLYRQSDMNFVNNIRTGIQYGHVFMRDQNNNIPENFLDNLPKVRSKFDYLKRKFYKNANSCEKICFIRRDINSAQAASLERKIVEIFPSLDFQIACVNSQDLGIWKLGQDRILDLRVADGGNDGLGNPQSWASALVEAGLVEQPFLKAKEEIVIPFH